jgi:hypothetical protein
MADEDRRAVLQIERVVGGGDVALERQRLVCTTLTLNPSAVRTS